MDCKAALSSYVVKWLKNAVTTLLALSAMCLARPQMFAQSAKAQPTKASFLSAPLSFEANRGQTSDSVKFLSHGDGYTLFLTANESVFKLRTPKGIKAAPSIFRMELLGANRDAQVSGTDKLGGVANYYVGNDPKNWRSAISTYGKVQYKDIYRGVDAVFYGNQRQLEYDFVVAPNADPRQISLGLTGAKPSLDADGNVVLKLTDGDLALKKPVVYQNIDGQRKSVEASYLISNNKVHFHLGDYDHSQTLVIDPVFTYATYLGGNNADQIGAAITLGQIVSPNQALALDDAGNVYVTGATLSDDFPVANAIRTTRTTTNWTAFVSALNASGTQLIYSTYLGGSGYNGGASIAWDSADNSVYVVGTTVTFDFPTTPGAFQRTNTNAGSLAFVAKFSSSGQLTNSTFLGAGTSGTSGFGIATDSQGRAYVTGYTSFNCGSNPAFCFTTTPGALIPAGTASGNGDGFVSVLDPTLSTLLYSTILGDPNGLGGLSSEAFGVTVDASENFYVVGITGSPNLPTTPGAFQPVAAPPNTQLLVGFAAKFGPVSNGAPISYLTYLEATGTTFGDIAAAVTADSQGNAYIGGYTSSATFPVTIGAYQSTCSQFECAFITKLNPTGTGLVWSTLVAPADYFSTIQLDALGDVYVTGHNNGAFPAVNALQPTLSSGGFVAKLDPTGSKLLFSSLIGGADGNPSAALTGVAVDSLGSIYIAGNLNDNSFPITPGAAQPTFAGGSGALGDGIIAKITLETPDVSITNSHTGNFSQGQSGATYSLVVTNNGNSPTSGTVSVTETIPAGLTLVSMSGTGWDCSMLPTCTRADALAISGSYPAMTVTVNIAANAPGSVTNIATVSGGGEFNGGNDNADDATTIIPVVVQVAVPDVVGLTQAVADTAITNANLVLGTLSTASSSSVPSGNVISESPSAGTQVNSGSAVSLVVSSGPAPILVPNVVGSTQAAATSAITNAGLVLGTVTTASSSTVASGNVISESPSAGTQVNAGSAVNLVVSSGAPQVPDMTISKSHTANFKQGQSGAIYTIAVSNVGNGPSTGNVTAHDTIPTGLTLVNMAGTGWSCNLAQSSCSRTDVLAAGGSYPTITVTVNVAANAPASVVNSATVSGGGETNTANDTANDGTSIVSSIQSQTITFPSIATQTFPAAPITLNATASSGLPVSYAASGPATVSGNILTITGGGSLTVQASQAGNANFSPATPVSQTFAVNQAPSITSANTATLVYGTAGSFAITSTGFPTATISETGALPGGVTFTKNSNGTATVSGSPTAVGTFAITFSASNGVGSPATQSFVLRVAPAVTTTTAQNASAAFSSSAQSVTLHSTVTSATGAVNSGTVAFTVSGVGTATSGTVSGGNATATLTIPAGTIGGNYTIQAAYSGTTTLASSSDSKTLTISGAAPTNTIASAASAHFSLSSQTVTLFAEVTSGRFGFPNVNGGTVTFTVSGVGTATSGTVASGETSAVLTLPAGLAGGTYTITETYSGTDTYAASRATNTLSIFSANTTTTAQSASATYNSSAQTVTLTAAVTSPAGTVNGGAVQFTVGLLGVRVLGTVTGGTASAVYTIPAGTAPGAYPIQAIYEGTSSFNLSIDNSKSLTIAAPSSVVITWPTPAPITYGTLLSATQLDATANVAGTFSYQPSNFSLLNAGTQTLSVTFYSALRAWASGHHGQGSDRGKQGKSHCDRVAFERPLAGLPTAVVMHLSSTLGDLVTAPSP